MEVIDLNRFFHFIGDFPLFGAGTIVRELGLSFEDAQDLLKNLEDQGYVKQVELFVFRLDIKYPQA